MAGGARRCALGCHCAISAVIVISVNRTAARSIETTEISCRVAGYTCSRIDTGIAIIATWLTSHGGCVTVPAEVTGIIAEHFGYIVIGVSCWTGSSLMVHEAEFHLRKDIGND